MTVEKDKIIEEKKFYNNFKEINQKRRNCFRDKLNIVFKVIRSSEYIHPKCRNKIIEELKQKLKEQNQND